MRKSIDITGQRFGRLIAIKEVERKNAIRRYLCHCDCGNEKVLTVKELRSGHTKSCGCLRNRPSKNRKNLIGVKFGRLTVISETNKLDKNGRLIWHCRCACGTELDVIGHDLTTGNTTSCGCKAQEHRNKINDFKEAHRVENVLVPTLKRKIRVDNKTGVKGVYFNKRQQRYVARIQIKNKNIYLGTFSKLEDAATARKAAEEKYFKPYLDVDKNNATPKGDKK
ncbi:AP2 domain-containing protein [Sporolactobacillus shoreicorticis]|uniref:AP2 domain-containing protein n=1 Tax=Sporolactobacillus shoreicorticis TaxID=1923877 RepID=A0ABW5S5V8_9BACL|nr:AP2 domain-containing protein [Sporolactobacillus shoreicorticis]MCO7127838.1 AP2 domain-containing protein [Sporolactobacillus shoreicorticis]